MPTPRHAVIATLAFWALAASAQTPAPVVLDDLHGLRIDKTEVTIAQFARYARATGTTTRAEREGGGFEYVGGWQRRAGWTWQRPDGSQPDTDQLPAVHLTHTEAQAYCQWAGGRLPTAAEWRTAGFTESALNNSPLSRRSVGDCVERRPMQR